MAFRPYASAYAGLDCLDATSEVSSRSRTPSCSSGASTACSSPGPAGTPAVFKKQTAPADAPSAKRWGLGDFSLHEQLGSGFAGCVHQVRLRGSADRSAFALKVMRKSDVVKQGQVGRVMSERRVLSSIRHPFVVEFITSFQDEARLFVLMEHVSGGDLFGVLDRAGRLPVDSARFYASEVALALDHLHSVDVLHRDLKPENVLLDCKGHVKLADFGCAKVVQGSSYTVCGTPEYTSPEMVGGGGHGKAVDWWAFGVLVFELLSGFTPFEVSDRSQAEIFRRIVAVDVEFPDYFDEESRDLVEGLLVKQPSGRLGGRGGAAGVMAHPWFEAVDWSRAAQKQCAPPSVAKTSRWSPAALARGLRGLKNRNRGLGAEAVPDEQQGMFFGFSFQGPTRLDAMVATTTDGSPSCDRGAGIWWGAPSCVAAAAAALTALVLARGAGGC